MSSESVLIAGRYLPTQGMPLFSVAQIRAMEAQAAASLPPHTLMQRAGLALARLALALAPHARTIWIACGPGNNGGDGFEAAVHLKAWGKNPVVSYLPVAQPPVDAALSIDRARAAGVPISTAVPADFDVAIDALFGIGALRPLCDEHVRWMECMNSAPASVLAADNPTGLDMDNGNIPGAVVQATATLAFLGLKPGLFTGHGRDVCGDIWVDPLEVAATTAPAAVLNPMPPARPRAHASHKGSFGDVAIVGGDSGMLGAALLAARAALHHGAGRVYVAPLDPQAPRMDAVQPELMFRSAQSLAWNALTVVAGCGGGMAIGAWLPAVTQEATRLVLDADALNALASSTQCRQHVQARLAHTTVLTPHPLEAARLLNCSTAKVQADRLRAAQMLADTFGATVVLKGSGTVIAAPGLAPHINPTGNARLATGGTGDVLAGMVGAALASGLNGFEAACTAVYEHGWAAQTDPTAGPVVAASALLLAH